MPMLLSTPLSQFVCIEIQYRSLSVRHMQQDATGLELSVVEHLPTPWEEELAEMILSALGLYNVRMLRVVNSFFEISESFILGWVHSQAFFVLNSSWNSLDSSAMFGENLPSWLTSKKSMNF